MSHNSLTSMFDCWYSVLRQESLAFLKTNFLRHYVWNVLCLFHHSIILDPRSRFLYPSELDDNHRAAPWQGLWNVARRWFRQSWIVRILSLMRSTSNLSAISARTRKVVILTSSLQAQSSNIFLYGFCFRFLACQCVCSTKLETPRSAEMSS